MSALRTARARKRFARDGMFWFLIHAHPSSRTGRWAKLGGAYVACWVHFRQREGALLLARRTIREDGWRVRSVQEQHWIDGPKHAKPGTLRYYREALEDGASFVYHRYPRGT